MDLSSKLVIERLCKDKVAEVYRARHGYLPPDPGWKEQPTHPDQCTERLLGIPDYRWEEHPESVVNGLKNTGLVLLIDKTGFVSLEVPMNRKKIVKETFLPLFS